MADLLLICSIFFACVYYFTYHRSRKRLYELAAKIPGPFDWPLIGSVHLGIRYKPQELFDYMLQHLHTIETPVRAWLGPTLFVFFDRPEHIAVILNSPSCVKRSYYYKFFRFEKGLLSAEPQLWRLLRKRLNPSFSSTIINQFVPIFNKRADKLVQTLDKFVGREAFDMLPKASSYTLSSTLLTLLGANVRVDNNDYLEQFADNSMKMFLLMWRRIYKPWIHLDFTYQLTSNFRKEQNHLRKLRDLSYEVYYQRQSIKSTQKIDQSEDVPNQKEILIERLESMTTITHEIDEEILMTNIDTFLFASNDTTSFAIATTLLMMAMHPEVQDRAYQEVIAVIPQDGYITTGDLASLEYLEMVIKESLRLIPVVAILGKICEQELQIGEWTIPVGAEVNIPIFKLHRDKTIWGERSDEFDPDNFLPERCSQRHPYAYIPFSAGIRNCIGMRYAWISLKIVLAKLIKQYKFTTALTLKDLKFQASIVLVITNGHMMRIERRA
ncbi:cytochrome P450 4C1-like [Wyeomyia smithii]|uniref:cytochrome P450 4C1-like n=1 Tax=Wyeomyia smithii TaxID=174621 RepID=UPI002467F5FB|nr:cytochrome P450 4C1-like [Wyeomyia smithii]